MAKQSGLHQIRGKVGEHSYYRQTGVSSGLIRSINQGMSARVKNDEAYVNTRKNNQEFAFAAEIAGRLGTFVQPKFRPMVLPFSQSKMAKSVLDLIKTTGTSVWGWRGIAQADFSEVLKALNDTAKYPFENFISEVTTESSSAGLASEDWDYAITFQTGAPDLLSSIGAQGVYVKAIAINVLIDDPVVSTLSKGTMRTRVTKTAQHPYDSISGGQTENESISNISIPVNPGSSVYHRVLCVMVMPYREIAGANNILQEYCSFTSLEVPEPEE